MKTAKHDPDAVARSLGDLIATVGARIERDKRVLWFRGDRSATWPLRPSIWRKHN